MSEAPVDYTVTYLEMTDRPAPGPELPLGQAVSLLRADDPPVDYFVYLYRAVGAPHAWTEWVEKSEAERAAFVSHPEVTLHTMMLEGWPGGFFMLDTRAAGICDISYFGLVRRAHGRGLGKWLLGQAIQTAWDRPEVARVTVNTCTLDHPRALPLYQQMGFEPVRRESGRRVLPPEAEEARRIVTGA